MPTALELKQRFEQKQGEIASFAKARQTKDGLNFRGDDLTEFNQRNAELKSLREQLDGQLTAEATMADNARYAGELKAVRRAPLFGAGGSAAGSGGTAGASIKSIGEAFIDSREYQDNSGGSNKYSVELAGASLLATGAHVKAISTTDVLPYPAQQVAPVPFATRRPVVADLIPQTDTDQPSIVYLEQTAQTFGADTVAEGDLKPESDFSWTRRTVSFEVIAHYAKISMQSLEDVPAIRDILNQEMVVGLQLAEEDQLLNGSGVSPDLQGFLNAPGVQSQAKGSDNIFGAFMSALTKIRFTGRANPDGAIFHPNDWQTLVTYQDSQGRFIFGDPSAIMQSQTVWGIRSIVTDAMTENTALIGAFQTYSRLWRKGGVRVVVDMTGDDLIRNLRTILVEERAALQISRGSAFCRLTGI